MKRDFPPRLPRFIDINSKAKKGNGLFQSCALTIKDPSEFPVRTRASSCSEIKFRYHGPPPRTAATHRNAQERLAKERQASPTICRLKISKRSDTWRPPGGPYLAVIKAPAAAISGSRKRTILFDAHGASNRASLLFQEYHS